MGWVHDGLEGHEGDVVNVLLDGRIVGTEDVTFSSDLAADNPAGAVTWGQVACWRGICSCGWSGIEISAVSDDHGVRRCPEHVEDQVFATDWSGHIAPLVAVADLKSLRNQVAELQARIDVTARTARDRGATWTQIGDALGLTKQGAQQRFGD